MSELTLLYGRNGQQAAGDPQVAELLARTVSGQSKAVLSLDELTAGLESTKTTVWTTAIPPMAVAHSRWLSAMLWQMATCYLDGNVVAFQDVGALPAPVYHECDSLCDQADAMTLRAIQLQSGLEQDVRPANATLTKLPSLASGGQGYVGVWYALEAVFLQVRNDLKLVEAAGTLKQMQPVYQEFKAIYQPLADQYAYLVSSWETARSEQNQRELVRTAQPLAEQLFALGQQVWAPYMLGKVYVEALQYKPRLEDLDLGFDPWVVVDPAVRQKLEKDPKAAEQLNEFWVSNPDPSVTLDLQKQIEAAHGERKIRYVDGGAFTVVPWQSKWLVHSPLTLGEVELVPGDYFALYMARKGDGSFVNVIRKAGRIRLAYSSQR